MQKINNSTFLNNVDLYSFSVVVWFERKFLCQILKSSKKQDI